MSLSVVTADQYADEMLDCDDDEMLVSPSSEAPSPGLGISPGDPRMLPFPMNVAACVLITTVDDLKSGEKRRRSDARYCVQQGWLEPWIDVLGLPDDATRRVVQLLDDLAAGRPQY